LAWLVPACIVCHVRLGAAGLRGEGDLAIEYGIDLYAMAQGLWNRKGDARRQAHVILSHKVMAEANLSRRKQRSQYGYRRRGR
jgi:hypothetical protein